MAPRASVDSPERGANVLVVEDMPSMAQLLQAYLEKGGHQVRLVSTGLDAMAQLQKDAPDVIVLDLGLPDISGQDILAEVARQELPCSVVVVTGDGSLRTAVEAMRAGAYDFVVKPVSADRLNQTVRNALERVRLKSAPDARKGEATGEQFCGFVGTSTAMQAAYRIIGAAAPSNATVFITGESGTGKELCAEAIHQLSPRRTRPFVPLNCGAIPKDLMESEIFGHVRGSFTGALADRSGAARQADGGTLFLDEICELQTDLQTKLLRFLQTGAFRAVGGTRLEQVDIRVVCATNRNPLAEVQAGRFREDLYYRLHVIPIRLPPLRERQSDVLAVARHFIKRFGQEERKHFLGLDASAEAALTSYDWPGNVRELQNVLRHAIVMHDGELLTAAMLPMTPAPGPHAREPAARAAPDGQPTDPGAWATPADIVPLWHVERATIERAIDLCAGNIPRAAAFLGISPSTIYRKRQAWETGGVSE